MRSGQVEVQGLQVNYKRIKDEDYIFAYRYSKSSKRGRSFWCNTKLDVK